MASSFQDLAAAVRETRIIGLQTLARLTGNGLADAEELDDMRARKDKLREAAELFDQLGPHEALIRSIVTIGGLADFPNYTVDLSALRAGATGLVRGKLLEDFGDQCQFEFSAPRARTSCWVSRSQLVGLERPVPSLWKPLTGQ